MSDKEILEAKYAVATTKHVIHWFKTEEAAQRFVGNLNFSYYDHIEIEKLDD